MRLFRRSRESGEAGEREATARAITERERRAWDDAAEREREAEREEVERLRRADLAFNEQIKRIGFHFPNDGAPYAPLGASARRPHSLGGRISDAMRALFGDPR